MKMFGKHASIAIIAMVLGLASPLHAEEEVSVEDLYQAGLDAYNAGDLPGAMAKWRPAAEAGNAEAQAWLGYIHDQSEDNEEAVRYYRAAAEQGNVEGIAGLAEMYVKGEGVEKDFAEALKYFKRAGELGHGRSIRVLIYAFKDGGLGVEPDATELAYWQAKEAALDTDNKDG